MKTNTDAITRPSTTGGNILPQDKLLTPADAMNILGISYSTLLRKIRQKEMPCIRIGKSLRFPRSYFETLETQALAEMAVK